MVAILVAYWFATCIAPVNLPFKFEFRGAFPFYKVFV